MRNNEASLPVVAHAGETLLSSSCCSHAPKNDKLVCGAMLLLELCHEALAADEAHAYAHVRGLEARRYSATVDVLVAKPQTDWCGCHRAHAAERKDRSVKS